MAQMFLSESSRRPQQIPESEMQDRWAMAFGEQKKQVCSSCEKPVHKTTDGLCQECIRDPLASHMRMVSKGHNGK